MADRRQELLRKFRAQHIEDTGTPYRSLVKRFLFLRKVGISCC